jgi:hypothetical protein
VINFECACLCIMTWSWYCIWVRVTLQHILDPLLLLLHLSSHLGHLWHFWVPWLKVPREMPHLRVSGSCHSSHTWCKHAGRFCSILGQTFS